MQVEDQASRAIYARLRHRARTLRGLAVGFVALIALTLAFGAIPYFLAGDMAVSETRAALEMRRTDAAHAPGVEKRDTTAGEPANAASADAADPPPQAPARPPAEPAVKAGTPPALPAGDEVLAAAVIRITAVVLLIGLTLVFGGLYRYSMRLAAYYDEKADSLRLLEAGDQQLEQRLSQITVPNARARGARGRSVERI